jgi:thiol-disulfide isomerase/thioredoxin
MKSSIYSLSINIIICLLASELISAQIPTGILSLEDAEYNSYYLYNAKIPVVKGRILNLSPDDFGRLKISYSIVTPFDNLQNKKSTIVSKDGSFNLQLDYPFPFQQIWLSIGDTLYTCLYANTDLYIELDASKIDKKNGINFNGAGIKFLGSDGELTNLMNNHILFKRKEQLEISKEIMTLTNDRSLTFSKFIIKYDELYSKLQKLDNEFNKVNPSRYSWLMENERMSRYYRDLIPKFYNTKMDIELWERVNKHKSYSISNEGMGFYRNLLMYISISSGKYRINDWRPIGKYSRINANGKNLIDSLAYYQETNKISQYNRLAGKAFATFSDTLATITTRKTITYLDSVFLPAKADYLKIKLGSKDQNEQITILDLVSKNLSVTWCKNVIDSEFRIIKENSLEVKKILQGSKPITTKNSLGQPIAELQFGAKLYSVNNIQASELLANIKNTFKGKAFLLDFWATWCAPCLSEMPFSIKLQQGAKDLPIEFVYLCTSNNSSQDKWRQKIAELKIPGTHIFVDENIENSLMDLFSGEGFPTYVLIDSRGTYNSQFLRPSLTDIKTLEKLIENK